MTVFVGSTVDVTVYEPTGRVPALTDTVADAPAARAPTCALPTTVPPTLTLTLVAGALAEPVFCTVADSVTWLVSVGFAGVHVVLVTTRSGFGAGVPKTCSSATWPPGAPELA